MSFSNSPWKNVRGRILQYTLLFCLYLHKKTKKKKLRKIVRWLRCKEHKCQRRYLLSTVIPCSYVCITVRVVSDWQRLLPFFLLKNSISFLYINKQLFHFSFAKKIKISFYFISLQSIHSFYWWSIVICKFSNNFKNNITFRE